MSVSKPEEVIRGTANFHPNIWGDQFITYTCNDEVTQARKKEQVEELKEKVRIELMAAAGGKPSQQLKLIDVVQRLGMEYLFESELEQLLQAIYHSYDHGRGELDSASLSDVSLWFRLLRQQGYNVSPDIFNKFIDEKGNFQEFLMRDTQDILGLYEAAHLRVQGEDILDEALAFTTIQLMSIATTHPLAAQVSHALRHPIRKGLPRLEARHYMSVYQNDVSHNKKILELAKLHFNLQQNLHKEELSHITRWWKELNFATKLPFARDRSVECYFWALAVYFEPQYSVGRSLLTKVLLMTSIIDDIHDVHGTIEELELFSQAIERWDINSIGRLPSYMKLSYTALLDVYEEIEQEMIKLGKTYRVHYAKEAMKSVVKAYFLEAKWLNENYMPNMEEYMKNALTSSGTPMLIVTSFVCMGEEVTDETFEWAFNYPKIITASAVIARLKNDLVSHKFERTRSHVASSVECYMKEHSVSDQQAYDELENQVVNAWKDTNQECLTPTDAPKSVLNCVLNFSRSFDVIYKEGDGYTHVGKEMKFFIASLLIDPVPI